MIFGILFINFLQGMSGHCESANKMSNKNLITA